MKYPTPDWPAEHWRRARWRRRGALVAAALGPMVFGLAMLMLVGYPRHRLFRQPNLPHGGRTFAFFEMAPNPPAPGDGFDTACACVNPKGVLADGSLVTMTFARASAAWCTKGNETTGIANGDLVECGSGLARVQPGGDGTGGLGLGRFEARTNVCIRSAEFENVAWADFTAGIGVAPVRGPADTDVSPAGTTTAEKVTFNATGILDSSGLSQTVLTAAAYSGSLFAQGNATTGSGSFDICIDTAAAASCTTCSFVLATATRCSRVNVTSKASGKVYIGNLSSLNGGITRAGVTPTIWGGQAELGATVGPYIATTAAAATRVAETASFAASVTSTGMWPVETSCTAATIVGPLNVSGTELIQDGSNYAGVDTIATAARCSWRGAGGITTATAGTPVAGTQYRIACKANPTNLTAYLDGVAGTPVAIVSALSATLNTPLLIGGHSSASFPVNGTIKRVVWGNTDTGCSP